MPSFKKLALIATEIQGKTSAETVETADTTTDPKTIPPAFFQKQEGGKIDRLNKMSKIIINP